MKRKGPTGTKISTARDNIEEDKTSGGTRHEMEEAEGEEDEDSDTEAEKEPQDEEMDYEKDMSAGSEKGERVDSTTANQEQAEQPAENTQTSRDELQPLAEPLVLQRETAKVSPSTRVLRDRAPVDYSEITRQYEQGDLDGDDRPFRGPTSNLDEEMEAIRRLTRRGRKRRRQDRQDRGGEKFPVKPKKGPTGGRVMSEALNRIYGEAQRSYMRAEYNEALRLLRQIVHTAPNCPDPYQLIGQIYEDQQLANKAAEYYLLGCQFGPKDAPLWKKTGQLFLELGMFLKASYCFGRAIKLDRGDVEAIADRAEVMSQWGKVDRAVLGYEQILRLQPPKPEAWLIRLAEDCLRASKLQEKGIAALGEVLCRCLGTAYVSKQIKFLPQKTKTDRLPASKDMESAFEAASLLCDHLMAPSVAKYEQAAAVLQAVHLFIVRLRERQTRFEDESPDHLALPLDLAAKYGICYIHLGDKAKAQEWIQPLRKQDVKDIGIASLLENVADAWASRHAHHRALELLRPVQSSPSLPPAARLRIGLRMARSYLASNQAAGAVQILQNLSKSAREGGSDEALREIAVLGARAQRVLKDIGGMKKCVLQLGKMLQEVYRVAQEDQTAAVVAEREAREEEEAMSVAPARRRRRRWRSKGGSTPDAAGASVAEKEDERVRFEQVVSSVEGRRLELEIFLEYAQLCRALGRQHDFFSVFMTIVELAVHQSKKDGRRLRYKATARVEGEEEDEEARPEPVPSSGTIVVPELIRRKWSNRTMLQQQIESYLRTAFGHMDVTELLGEAELFGIAEAVVQACVEMGMLKEAVNIAKAITKRRKLLSEEHGKALHEYVMIYAVHEDDYSSAIKAALANVASQTDNNELCNSLARLVRKASNLDLNRGTVRRMAYKEATSLPLNLIAATAYARSRNYKMALDRFLVVYKLCPQEPLTSLGISTLLLRVFSHRRLIDRHGCLLKALAFLQEYVKNRRAAGPDLSGDEEGGYSATDRKARAEAAKIAVEQEVLYNMGRAFHQVNILPTAIQFYREALQLFDDNKAALQLLGDKGHLTREVALNLSSIYQNSENRVAAVHLAQRYLTIE